MVANLYATKSGSEPKRDGLPDGLRKDTSRQQTGGSHQNITASETINDVYTSLDNRPDKYVHASRKNNRTQKNSKGPSVVHGPNLYWNPHGRLGNQLFEFATAYCTALQSNHTPTIKNTAALLSMFKLEGVVQVSVEYQKAAPSKAISEKKCCFMQPHILEMAREIPKEVVIRGYLHSYKYMLPCWKEVQKQLVLLDVLQKKVTDYIQLVTEEIYSGFLGKDRNGQIAETFASNQPRATHSSNHYTYIGVHIRRTDRRSTYAPIRFFQEAFRYYESRYKNIVFMVCSDDIRWCEEALKELPSEQSEIVFMSGRTKDYRVDFGILVNCNHSIVTAGTFSWWSGWLARGEVIYHTGYNDWQLEEHPDRYKKQDFYPNYWIPMT